MELSETYSGKNDRKLMKPSVAPTIYDAPLAVLDAISTLEGLKRHRAPDAVAEGIDEALKHLSRAVVAMSAGDLGELTAA